MICRAQDPADGRRDHDVQGYPPLPAVAWPSLLDEDGAGRPRLRTIRVGDTELTPTRILRELVFLQPGHVAYAIRSILAEDWRQRRVVAGSDPEDFEVSDAEIRERIARNAAQLANVAVPVGAAPAPTGRMPVQDFSTDPEAVRAELTFEKVFMGGPPAEWPEVSKSAIIASQGDTGEAFWSQLAQLGDRPLPLFWQKMVRDMLHKGLVENAVLHYPHQGLPPHVALVVNGQEWAAAKGTALIMSGMTPHELRLGVREVVAREVLRQELAQEGMLLGRAEFDAAYAALEATFEPPFGLDVVAKLFEGYPSAYAHRQRWRLLRSFEVNLMAKPDEARLKAHAETHKIWGGKVGAEFLRFDGNVAARDALARLEAGATWSDLRAELHPDVDNAPGAPATSTPILLGQQLGESRFTDLLVRDSVLHTLFAHGDSGETIGPVDGAEGFYLARRVARADAGPGKVRDAAEPALYDEYRWFQFAHWARGVVERAVREGRVR